jgi:hypothetical protein
MQALHDPWRLMGLRRGQQHARSIGEALLRGSTTLVSSAPAEFK